MLALEWRQEALRLPEAGSLLSVFPLPLPLPREEISVIQGEGDDPFTRRTWLAGIRSRPCGKHRTRAHYRDSPYLVHMPRPHEVSVRVRIRPLGQDHVRTEKCDRVGSAQTTENETTTTAVML